MVITPNWFAYLALAIWPVAAVVLYSRLPVGRATLWTILGGWLLLPVGADIKIAGVPAFDKQSIPNLAALICCALFAGRLPRFFRGFGIAEVLLLILLISPFITSMFNHDLVRIEGAGFLPSVGNYDALSASVAQFIFILPFFLGRQFLRGPNDNMDILRILVTAGLAYSLPILFEIRFSPQLHIWFYGYFPHAFYQQMRDGGFRSVVFLGHGLVVAFFVMTTTVAAAALWRTQERVNRFSPGGITAYFCVILVLCKSLGSLVYGAVLLPLVRWTSPRAQLRVATVLAAMALAYPMLRVADLVPATTILNLAKDVSTDRAESLQTRFDQEKQLLDRAWERPWFGWGRFGRNRVYNGYQGRDSSITDGHWIGVLGTFGLVGFWAEFGLLTLAVFRAAMALKFAPTLRESQYLAALALIVAINIFDLLPNAIITPWTWLLVGALLGRAEALHAMARQRIPRAGQNLPPIRIEGGQGYPT